MSHTRMPRRYLALYSHPFDTPDPLTTVRFKKNIKIGSLVPNDIVNKVLVVAMFEIAKVQSKF